MHCLLDIVGQHISENSTKTQHENNKNQVYLTSILILNNTNIV